MQTLCIPNNGGVSTLSPGRQEYDAERVLTKLESVFERLDNLHSAAVDLKYARLPRDLPAAVKAELANLRRAASRWTAEINAARFALEQSEVRAELLANSVDPDDTEAVDRFLAKRE